MPDRRRHGCWRAGLVAWLVACLPLAHAGALRIDHAPAGPIGKWAGLMQEAGSLVGTAWIDRLDAYLVRDGAVVAEWQAGDSDTRLQRPEPGLGFVFDHRFEPGRTDLFVRAQTPDPLDLPVHLLSPGDAKTHERLVHYTYGGLYGFLLALAAYNALLFAGLRTRSHLDYSVYLACFIVLNLAYTGHGYAWLWPDWPGVQRYVILALMVFFGAAGLRFAIGFLDLDRLAPRVALSARLSSLAALGLLGLALLAGLQGVAALVAFTFALSFTIGMAGMGLLAVRLRHEYAFYFLAAALCAMAGAATTTLAVWGAIAFTPLTYRAVEVGVLLEAILLALALAYQVRLHQRARRTAEQLASTDPLTGLFNRRGFVEQGEILWSVAKRNGRPMALVVLDLDQFKAINDAHGHAAGDRALEETARLLGDACRRGDLLARWGGEEFVLLLPETTLAQAMAFAERLRRGISFRELEIDGRALRLGASLGVAARGSHDSLQALIADADARLYEAKEGGRNRVRGPDGSGGASPR